MQPEQYEAWYTTPRGASIGEEECHPLQALLAPRFGETVLDVGCGAGHFTRRIDPYLSRLAPCSGAFIAATADAAPALH